MQKKILIIRMSALGDILHGLPVAAAIKAAMPEAQVGWLVEARGAALLRGNPAIDKIHILRRGKSGEGPGGSGFMALAREIRREKYDVTIDLQGLTKSAVWGRLSGARERIGFAGENAQEVSGFFYNRAVEPKTEAKHIIQQNLELLRPLEIKKPRVEFPLVLEAIEREAGERLWGEDAAKGPRVLVNVGGGWPTKLWPAERFGKLAGRLAEKFGARVALAWGPGEEEAAGLALRESGAKTGAEVGEIPNEPGVYLLPKTSFIELGGCVGRADLYVGGDTGPTHLAAALGVACVSIFGPSDGMRNGPVGATSARGQAIRMIQLSEPACIPCWKTKCAWDEPLACLTGIGVDHVYEACAEVLRKGNG